MGSDERLDQAGLAYQRAVFDGHVDALATADRQLDAVEADLALARGRIIHARFLQRRTSDPADDPQELALFERAAWLYRSGGNVRGEAESLFWVGCFHQVVRRDNEAAVTALNRSHKLAAQVGDTLTMSYALRHLAIADQIAGRADQAQQGLTESTRLRRELGFLPGVAANLIGLAYLAGGAGRRDEAMVILAEAAAITEGGGAGAIAEQVEQARLDLTGDGPLPAP